MEDQLRGLRRKRIKKQSLERTEPVPDGYRTFFFQRDDP